jgi:uridine kinase
MSRHSYLIGIAGPSGAGKSYLACHLAERLHAPVLSLDRYYRDLFHLPLEARARFNFDDPAAIEHDLLIEQAAALSEGKAIEVPIYDFSTHTRTPAADVFEPGDFVILEGLFTLHWPELRDLLGTPVFVDSTDDICLRRRLERDVRERGRTPESVIEQFRTTVAPMAQRHVRPTRDHARVLVCGAEPIADSVARVLEHVKQHRHQSGTRAADRPRSLVTVRSR